MRIAIKIGTSVISGENGSFNENLIDRLCKTISAISDNGREVILISSGAVGLGAGRMGIKKYPERIIEKQALAAIGQCELMYMYVKKFAKYGKIAAQLLLTRDITERSASRKNTVNTINALFDMGVIPIVNENDSVSTEELENIDNQDKSGLKPLVFGDNDILSASVSEMIKADILVILTDIDGLYSEDPRKNPEARRIYKVSDIKECIKKISPGKGSAFSTGGMYSKLQAISIALKFGITCYITNGDEPEKIKDITVGRELGTVFIP